MDRERMTLRALDSALPLVGLGLLVIGAGAKPIALPFAWTALGLAFIAWLAEADGLAVPRPGRLRISSFGCWATPLAFSVRHGGRDLLFTREEDERGGWSSEYTIRERQGAPCDARFDVPVADSGSWVLRGRVPVSDLAFDHRERVSYVTRRSLRRALEAVR